MRLTIAILTLLLLAGSVVDARPAPRPADRAAVERHLSGLEQIPSRARLLAVHGPDVARVLREIASRPSRRRLASNRALALLRFFPSKATERLLAQIVDRNRRAKRGIALLDLARALESYAAIAGARALPRVRAILSHKSVDVRVAAAAALRLTRAPRARALLLAHRRREPSATVRAEVGRQLQLLTRERKARAAARK